MTVAGNGDVASPVEPLLSVGDLGVRFGAGRGGADAVRDVSFTVTRGEITAIIGETGSGKSTVARAILGLLSPAATVTGGWARLDTGQLQLDLLGASHRELRGLRGKTLGFVPQATAGALHPVISIKRQFDKILRTHGAKRGEATDEMVASTLSRVGIRDPERVLGGYAHQLSGGMAQRVVIAMALAMKPDLVIADEPTTGLDLTVQRNLLEELTTLTVAQDRGLILITHDLGVVAQYCQRVIVLYSGHVIETGSVSAVFGSPSHPYTRWLLEAVPERGRKLKALEGTPASVESDADGCPFYARCPLRSDPRCATVRPPLRSVSGDHRVASFCATGGRT